MDEARVFWQLLLDKNVCGMRGVFLCCAQSILLLAVFVFPFSLALICYIYFCILQNKILQDLFFFEKCFRIVSKFYRDTQNFFCEVRYLFQRCYYEAAILFDKLYLLLYFWLSSARVQQIVLRGFAFASFLSCSLSSKIVGGELFDEVQTIGRIQRTFLLRCSSTILRTSSPTVIPSFLAWIWSHLICGSVKVTDCLMWCTKAPSFQFVNRPV